jgi:hypothetical protein
MSNSYRIRTKPGIDSSIKILIDQEFEYLEILSLKILQSQIYTRMCSDYGVIVGRVSVNNGFGIPNAKVSVFIPLDSIDENNPIITDIYPYKTLTDVNDEGYRYNLLPYKQQHSGHNPTGTFFTREDVLTNPTLIEVYDKYFKYTAVTNESGDYMIFGVPVGAQTIVVDIDLSDIGEFSLSPQDLVRMGVANESQLSGTKFKSSTNLRELPQIITINRTIEVEPLWGQPEICNLGITRTDFDLSGEANIDINPTAIFMGSLVSTNEDDWQQANCRPNFKHGNLCSLVAGPGEIQAIRQTIFTDSNGRPVLEVADLEQGGQVIDENGTWLIDLPMNMDFVVTNEFGEQVMSNDPKVGIPTTAKYRFKIKWNQEPNLSENYKRGYYLVPNIKEWGWSFDNTGKRIDPLQPPSFTISGLTNTNGLNASYAFSLDWEEYGEKDAFPPFNLTQNGLQMIDEAINCEDRFYKFHYNKVYTVSQLIDQYRKGFEIPRIIALKNNLDSECASENNRFPNNDAILRVDLLYLLFLIMLYIFKPILYILILVIHILYVLLKVLAVIIAIIVFVVILLIVMPICYFISFITAGGVDCPDFGDLIEVVETIISLPDNLTNIKLPNLSYPQCDLCDCGNADNLSDTIDDSAIPGLDVANQVAAETGAKTKISLYPISSSFDTQKLLNDTNPIDEPSEASAITQLLSGKPYNSTSPTSNDSAPQGILVKALQNSGNMFYWTKDLPIAERINLFNTKAKYFNTNSFDRVNQIQVKFNYPSNNSSHTDNVFIVSAKPGTQSYFTPGQMITFQDPKKSGDPNITGYTLGNQFGTNGITGTPITNQSITVSYVNENGTTVSTPYNIIQGTNDISYHKFPIDIEYFQVITAMTVSQAITNYTGNNLNSLIPRFINNQTQIDYFEIGSPPTIGNFTLTNTIDYFVGGQDQVIVIMVRGVDPNSTRNQNEYDLSKIFGDTSFGNPNLVVRGDYKLNIPIQGNKKCYKHDTGSGNLTLPDPYSNNTLFYNSYHYQPDTTLFSGFTTELPKYYSSSNGSDINLGIVVPPINQFVDNSHNRNYYSNEAVDGGSYITAQLGQPNPGSSQPTFTSIYVSPTYGITQYTFPSLIPNGRNIVMRSDRLPTSTQQTIAQSNSFVIQNNITSEFFSVSDDGIISNPLPPSPGPISSPPDDSSGDTTNFTSQVLDSFSCRGMVPLGCYGSNPNNPTELIIKDYSDSCWKNGFNQERFTQTGSTPGSGCYIFVTSPPILSYFTNDIGQLSEWLSRIQITFAACRNVWNHIFSNSWINGMLYAFGFANDRFFTGPLDNPPNSPYSEYCRDTVILHPTNNFYYRCSPYSGGTTNKFIGADAPTPPEPFKTIFGDYNGNKYNLKYPTTIMDLGPRSFYLQELSVSDKFDGYVVNRLKSTTYTDVSQILNLLIISRLMNTGFLSNLIGIGGANIQDYFSRPKGNVFPYAVDGDYAQLISISSELGVNQFQSNNYPDNPTGQDPVYFNGVNQSNPVIGIFFSSDTRIRDFISPKRTTINPFVPSVNPCAYNRFPVFSQEIPMYQWEIEQDSSIFGNDSNDWYTEPLTSTNGFFSYKYQSLERDDPNSRYFRTNAGPQNNYFKGYIYSVSGGTNINLNLNANANSWSQNTGDGQLITTGNPWFFYFGLKKGKSAWDRFAKKWLNFEDILDE